MIYREIASELLIDPEAVDRERGVVLSEERGRASPPMRAAVANMEAMYPATPGRPCEHGLTPAQLATSY